MAPDETSTSRLTISSEDFADCRVVSLTGSIDHTNSDRFLAELGSLAGSLPQGGGMVIDLSKLDFITSAGLRALLLADSSAKEAGARLIVCGLSGTVQEVFRISMFDSLLSVAEGPEDGVAQVSDAAAQAFRG